MRFPNTKVCQVNMTNLQTQESLYAFNNDRLEEQDNPNKTTVNKGQCTSSEIIDMTATEPNSKEGKTVWFETSFGLVGAHGSIRKDLFISAVKQIEVRLYLLEIEKCTVNVKD